MAVSFDVICTNCTSILSKIRSQTFEIFIEIDSYVVPKNMIGVVTSVIVSRSGRNLVITFSVSCTNLRPILSKIPPRAFGIFIKTCCHAIASSVIGVVTSVIAGRS